MDDRRTPPPPRPDDTLTVCVHVDFAAPRARGFAIACAMRGGAGFLYERDPLVNGGVRLVGAFWIEHDAPDAPDSKGAVTWWRETGYELGIQPAGAS